MMTPEDVAKVEAVRACMADPSTEYEHHPYKEETDAETESESEEMYEAGMDEDAIEAAQVPFRYGVDAVEDDEELVHDPTTYDIYHQFAFDWPCMSFDILNNAGAPTNLKIRGKHSFEIVAGSYAETAAQNSLYIARCNNIGRTNELEDSDDEECDSGKEIDITPQMTHRQIMTGAPANKIQACRVVKTIVAGLFGDGSLRVYDVSSAMKSLDDVTVSYNPHQAPIFSVNLGCEGFALDWAHQSANFVVGDRTGTISYFQMAPGGWNIALQINPGLGDVEAIVIHPTNDTIFVSGHVGGNVAVWDLSQNTTGPMSVAKCHEGDCNALAFSPEDTNQVATGGDDGVITIRDISMLELELSRYKHHTDAINCLAFCPQDKTTFVAGSHDDSVTVWDTCLEEDKQADLPESVGGYAPQLLFQHCGHKMFATVRPLRDVPYVFVSCGMDNFHVWRPETLYEFARENTSALKE